MYDLKWLRSVARDGLGDMVPTVRELVSGEQRTQGRLQLVFGSAPRRNLLALAVFGVLAGELLALLMPSIDLDGVVNPAAALLGAAQAALIRRYLFRSDQADSGDFPWLAASIGPAILVLVLAQAWRGAVSLPGLLGASPEPLEVADAVVRLLADMLAVAAAYAVAMATLCYRRKWLRALWDLAVRLFVFQVTMWVMVLLFVEIGIVGPIASALIGAVTGWYPPDWLGDLADVLTYALLMGVVLLAVIGATWIVCRDNFDTLLAEGEVDVLESLNAIAQSPEARARQEVREQKETEKRERRAVAKQARRKGRGGAGESS
ncbi:MAG: hypothetical protein AAF184_02685 [Pseudomonadota bacterium]